MAQGILLGQGSGDCDVKMFHIFARGSGWPSNSKTLDTSDYKRLRYSIYFSTLNISSNATIKGYNGTSWITLYSKGHSSSSGGYVDTAELDISDYDQVQVSVSISNGNDAHHISFAGICTNCETSTY